ncbi:hypothetical protein LROSL1_2305 [Furfurilactobacillus rossiae]|uniref:SMI1/KNR4 family protein n=1 Tax=Furfurilactobacillus rossiae TaxID=231049 RepID=UPI0015BA0662|nr:SMI1/KNR4 family protein [Furfurilactobacillus rossiae]MCF6166325.1 hypothetical protein [Furfurilactobacillus rossiae]QLE65106.1 hypothetical protein LROSL1_2305 [Furfurilactobacillus rossiae]
MDQTVTNVINTINVLTNNTKDAYLVPTLGGAPIACRFKMWPGATKEDIQSLRQFDLPGDLIDFLSATNGLDLFNMQTEYGPLTWAHVLNCQEIVENYSLMKKTGLTGRNKGELVGVIHLTDIGLININIDRLKAGQHYLSYPAEWGSEYFNLTFAEWLYRYIVCGGSEFWNLQY